MKKLIIILLLNMYFLHAASCDYELKQFWQKYNGLSFLENVRNGNELAAQLLGMEFSLYDVGNKMNQAFGGAPLNGSGYLRGYLASIREACGGTNDEIQEAIADADGRFKSLYDQYYHMTQNNNKSSHISNQKKQYSSPNKHVNKTNMYILNPEEDGDVVEIEIKGNSESCVLNFSANGNIDKQNCLSITNSKGVKIFCTPKKKMCKTYKEIYSLVFDDISTTSVAVVRPSWCKNAKSSTEHAICNNDDLSKLDKEISENYKAWKDYISGESKKEFTHEQRKWIKKRNKCKGNHSCLLQEYSSRNDELLQLLGRVKAY